MLPQTVEESANALTETLSGLPSSIITMKDWTALDSRGRGGATQENVGWSARFEQMMKHPDRKTMAIVTCGRKKSWSSE